MLLVCRLQQIQPPLHLGGQSGVALFLGQALLVDEPGQQGAAPALGGSGVDGLLHHGHGQRAAHGQRASSHQARERVFDSCQRGSGLRRLLGGNGLLRLGQQGHICRAELAAQIARIGLFGLGSISGHGVVAAARRGIQGGYLRCAARQLQARTASRVTAGDTDR